MLLEFGMRNYMSFKEGVLVSLQVDAKAPKSVTMSPGVIPVLGIKGANGSGKTNILRALSFLGVFVPHSFGISPDGPVPVAVHFTSKDPVEFTIKFVWNRKTYIYELETTDEEIVRESIFRINKRKTKLLIRDKNKISYATKELLRLQNIKLRRNASVVSLAHQYDFDELNDVYAFFDSIVTNVAFDGLQIEPISEDQAAKILYSDKKLLEFVTSFIRECDVGVSAITIHQRKIDNQTVHFPIFMHGDDRWISAYTESSGTRALFRNLVRYRIALEAGALMIADELDIHLHPFIVPKLIGMFLDPRINTKKAQLIFSTHDADVLDILGKYRTLVVNKEKNESFGYRLDDISGDLVRNDRPIRPLYAAGKLGGVPKL